MNFEDFVLMKRVCFFLTLFSINFLQVINRGQVDVGRYGNIIMSGWGLALPQETVDQIAKRFIYQPRVSRIRNYLNSDLFFWKNLFLRTFCLIHCLQLNKQECFPVGIYPLSPPPVHTSPVHISLPPSTCWDTPPAPHGQTDACENITFLQLHLWMVIQVEACLIRKWLFQSST